MSPVIDGIIGEFRDHLFYQFRVWIIELSRFLLSQSDSRNAVHCEFMKIWVNVEADSLLVSFVQEGEGRVGAVFDGGQHLKMMEQVF